MIERKRDVWVASALLTLLTSSCVVVSTVLLYQPADWPRELIIGLSLAVMLTFPIGFYMALQILEKRQLSEELQRLLNRDRLTNVATRDFFFYRMEAEPAAYGVSLMIDIDDFKLVNDTHGHLAGDAVIRAVARILRDNCRPSDIVCRFGGEEFVVFLFEASPSRGAMVAERIRGVVEGAATTLDGKELRVTVSIGGSLKATAEDINRSIRSADHALYSAKRQGRNRTVLSWTRDRVSQLG